RRLVYAVERAIGQPEVIFFSHPKPPQHLGRAWPGHPRRVHTSVARPSPATGPWVPGPSPGKVSGGWKQPGSIRRAGGLPGDHLPLAAFVRVHVGEADAERV